VGGKGIYTIKNAQKQNYRRKENHLKFDLSQSNYIYLYVQNTYSGLIFESLSHREVKCIEFMKSECKN
jgi:hypothetical protein